MKNMIVCLMILLLSGCATAPAYLFRDKPNLVISARRLAEDYLEGQTKGESYREASKKYGRGVVEFYGLKAYRFERMTPDNESAILFYRIQSTNQMGGVLWKTMGMLFSYNEKMEAYEGLSISWAVVQN